jgi:CheY-like chemotaxis protein
LVRYFQSADRSNNRIPWRLVGHLADQLETNSVTEKVMNKVIEVDFLPRETDVAFSWLDSISDSARRILIVDNDRNTTHLIKILLEKTGRYLVFEENDPARAHQSARNFRPDLIFLDVVMPDRDGGEIAEQIRADSELQSTPIIFLTALVTRAEATAGLRIDGHPFLAKPIDIQELMSTIEAHLPLRANAIA